MYSKNSQRIIKCLLQPQFIIKYILIIIGKIYLLYQKYTLKKLGPISIISNNCIAGFLYKKYGMKYYSPTIGLQFLQSDFVKFCSNFEHYINYVLEESDDKKQDGFNEWGGGGNFPVGILDDIIIYFQHYNDFSEAKIKWEERKNRINYNKTFFVFIVHNNTPIEVLNTFEKLPLKSKKILTFEERKECPMAFSMNNGNDAWFNIKNRNSIFPDKRYWEQFDFYNWFMKS